MPGMDTNQSRAKEQARAEHKKKLVQAYLLALQEQGFAQLDKKDKQANPDLYRSEHDRDLQKCIDLLKTEREECTRLDCRCKVDFESHRACSHLRAPKPVKEILTHQMHRDDIWLYCKLDTERAVPEFRRQCQLDINMVREYRQKLIRERKSPLIDDVWTMEQELRVRRKVFDQLDERQVLINQQLAQCKDTAEWAVLTNNAKELNNIRVRGEAGGLYPGPEKEGETELYAVERILGSIMNQGKLFYLVKWEGWASQYNTWESSSAFKGSTFIAEFISKYGKPNWKKPRILSPEGEEHMTWLDATEQESKRKLEQASLMKQAAASVKPSPSPATHSSGVVMQLSPVSKRKRPNDTTSTPVAVNPGPVLTTEDDEELYEVERVIGAKLRGRHLHYLIKWLGYDLDQNSWEPAMGVKKAHQAIKLFTDAHGKPTKDNPKVLSPEGRQFEMSNGSLSSIREEPL